MPEEKRHYLLDPMEAELLACYRLMSEQNQVVVITLVASLVEGGCQKLANHVEMRLVEK